MGTESSAPGARARSRTARRLAIGVGLALLASPALLHAWVAWRHELGGLYAGAAELRDRARELAHRARTFDQREALAALPANAKNGFCFRFDEHLDELRAVDAPAAGEKSSQPLLALEMEGADATALVSEQGASTVAGGVLSTTYAAGDLLATSGELALDPESVGQLEIRVKHARGTKMTIGWRSEGELQNRQGISLLPLHGEFYEYRLSTASLFQDTLWPFTPADASGASARSLIRQLVIEPSDVPGDQVEIDYLRLVSKRARYAASSHGESHETIAREMRKVVYANTPLVLEAELDLPPGGPLTLETGLGILQAGDPVTFRVRVRAGEEERELLAQEVADASAWRRAEVDVSEFAGKSVAVRFEAQSRSGNVAFWSNPALRGAPREPMNVVLLLEDALRADRLSCAGYARPTTPNKDRLAAQGVHFLRCYSQETKTRMSMPSMMTSLYPTATGVWNFHEVLHDNFLTLAEILRSQGFETASFTQNPNAGAGAGLHQGFSYLFELDKTLARPEEVYAAAQAWIAERKDRNLFLYLHIIDPHSPYDPPPPFDAWAKELGEGGTPVKKLEYYDPDWVQQPTKEGRRALYDGEVAHDDARFAEFWAWLGAQGEREDTLLVQLADHGEFLGEHGMWEHRTPGFAEVLHVPLIVDFPGRLPAGAKIRSPVQLLDLMPTVLELAGVDPAPLLLQGDSLVALMLEGDGSRFQERVVISDEVNDREEKTDDRALASLFYRDLHLLNSHDFSVHRRWPHAAYLRTFDARTDPTEHARAGLTSWDLVHKHRVASLVRELQAANSDLWLALTHGVSGAMDYDPEMIERLRSLGYL